MGGPLLRNAAAGRLEGHPVRQVPDIWALFIVLAFGALTFVGCLLVLAHAAWC